MNQRTYIYITIIVVMGVLAAAVALSLSPVIPGTADLAGWAVFVALGLTAEKMAVGFASDYKAQSSVLFLPLFALAVSFPPWMLILAVLIIVPVSEFFILKPLRWRAVFNTAQLVVCFGVAGIVYHALAGGTVAETGGPVIGAFGAMVIANFVLNTVIVVGFMAVRQKEPFAAIFARVVGPSSANLFYDFLASPIALVAAILYQDLYIKGVILILLPLYLIRYSYISKLQLQQANSDLLRVLIMAIETRDPYTSGHSQRVSTLATSIAHDMGLSEGRVRKIERAALLHDIGKIDAVYAPIISKPHDLTSEERDLIRTHAARGADLLQSLSLLQADEVDAVRHHHERWDGAGYPSGLSAEGIPLAARIIMVSDAIDAMLSDRPYRPALTIQHTESELRRCSGAQFDPLIVDVILRRGTLTKASALLASPAAPGNSAETAKLAAV